MAENQAPTVVEFRHVMGQFATGVAVATTWDTDGRAYGLTVNAFTSVSLQPMLVLICLDNAMRTLEVFKQSKSFGLCILMENQEAISNHYATRMTDRSQYLTCVGETGVPLLQESLAILECQVVQCYPGGDHTVLLAEVKLAKSTGAARGGKPLLFFQGRYRTLAAATS